MANDEAGPPSQGQGQTASAAPKNYIEQAIAVMEAQQAPDESAPKEAPKETPPPPPKPDNEEKPNGETVETPSKETTTETQQTPSQEENKGGEGEEGKKDLFAPKFEALARQSRKLREYEASLKAQAQKYEALQKEEELWRQNPLEALNKRGLSVPKLAELMLEAKETGTLPKPRGEPDERYTALEKRIEAYERQAKQEKEKAIIDGYREKIATVARTQPDKFELVNADRESLALAFQAIENHYNSYGEPPGGDWDKAIPLTLQKIEEALEEKASALLKTKKFAGKLNGASHKSAVEGHPVSNGHQANKTLTNFQAGTAPPRAASDKPKTAEEYRAAALRVLAGG